ncbi:MAG: ABC transporter permease [Chloroflexaceae bacterium]|nr:ABC transporter permease [Chloroflexaceae bacterium]
MSTQPFKPVNPIPLIVQREVREMLTDWRVTTPVLVLALLLPMLLAAAAGFVVNFVDNELATLLVPFTILLVGFIPASFSIVTALESFVGERERNTLESLMSMPLSDRELYISKLLSSLFTPIAASYTSMIIFIVLIFIQYPVLYIAGVSLDRLVLLVLMVSLLAVCMVSGAVIISSHTSSIRAANLMASFILLPAIGLVQFIAFMIISDRWDVFRLVAIALTMVALVLVRAGLGTFNREEILSREHQQVGVRWLRWLWRGNKQTAPDQAIATGQLARDSAVAQHLSPLRAVLTVVRREVTETMTDWRVLLPVLVLSLVLPLALTAGVPFAIDFVGSERLIAQLVPFGLLLVGFIPATFSLITALESFVGERERGSLEALLAMPITNAGLYVSKLVSSVTTPLLTSLSAMLVVALAMRTLYPDLYNAEMTMLRFFQLLLLIALMALVMVSAAVIISSHTSSIRAANLLASFVLVPVAITLQIQVLFFIAGRWDLVTLTMLVLCVVLIALIRTGLATFNREEILSREHDRLNLPQVVATFVLFFREYQPAGVLPDRYEGLPFSAGRFYRRELPALLRELRLPLLLAFGAVVIGAVAGWSAFDQANFLPLHEEVLQRVGRNVEPSPVLALVVFANNLRVSVLSNLLSLISFGLFAFLVPAVAFAQIAFVTRILLFYGAGWFTGDVTDPAMFLLAYVLPHGIIELPTFLFSTALGLRIGASVFSTPDGFSVGQNMLWAVANYLKAWLLVLVPLVLIAALVEGFITPLVVMALYP